MTITVSINPFVSMGKVQSVVVTVDALNAQAGEMAFATALVDDIQKFATEHINKKEDK